MVKLMSPCTSYVLKIGYERGLLVFRTLLSIEIWNLKATHSGGVDEANLLCDAEPLFPWRHFKSNVVLKIVLETVWCKLMVTELKLCSLQKKAVVTYTYYKWGSKETSTLFKNYLLIQLGFLLFKKFSQQCEQERIPQTTNRSNLITSVFFLNKKEFFFFYRMLLHYGYGRWFSINEKERKQIANSTITCVTYCVVCKPFTMHFHWHIQRCEWKKNQDQHVHNGKTKIIIPLRIVTCCDRDRTTVSRQSDYSCRGIQFVHKVDS